MNVVDHINGRWGLSDYLGAMKVRMGLGRSTYRVQPGLYSIGNPGSDSSVLVTANYKLTVDHLRRSVSNLDLWIVVLDTKGVNVWCAAGKGTFGTDELVKKIESTGLSHIVSHRKVIVPQLGAPGIRASEVKKRSGFTVLFGPVEAHHIKEYIDGGFKANEEMRRKRFPLIERLAVSLTHFTQGILITFAVMVLFLALDWVFLLGTEFDYKKSFSINSLLSLSTLFCGTLLTGALLPILPGRAFSLKGFFLGFIYSIFAFKILFTYSQVQSVFYMGGKSILLWVLIVYQALNLTGSSTYTSLSGVKKEMLYAIPAIITASAIGFISLVTGGLL